MADADEADADETDDADDLFVSVVAAPTATSNELW